MVWLVALFVILSCLVASATVDFLMNLTFSRLVLLGGGACPSLLVSWGCFAGTNPILSISEQRNPEVSLLLIGGVMVLIVHRGWVVPGVKFLVPFWPVWWCIFTAFLENVNVVLKCILSSSSWVMGVAPFFAPVMVDIFASLTSGGASKWSWISFSFMR